MEAASVTADSGSSADHPCNKMEQSKERGSHRKQCIEDTNKLRNITLLSLVLVIFSAIVLWFSRRDPLLVVWRLSQLLCLSFFWTSFLTER